MSEEFRFVAKTNPLPYGFEVQEAAGVHLYMSKPGESSKAYYDLSSGIGVNNVGHSHPEVLKAVTAQASLHSHVMVYGELDQSPQSQYAKALAEKCTSYLDMKDDDEARVWFSNSGAEAVDTALKLATLVQPQAYDCRPSFFALEGGFHGRTLGALGVSWRYRTAFKDLWPRRYCLWLDPEGGLPSGLLQPKAVIVEVIQGENGVRSPGHEFLLDLRSWCADNGVLFIVDEVQTGLYRTGEFLACGGLAPDIIVLGKAVGGGYPLGAVVARKGLLDAFEETPFTHLSTFGGHPVSCAAGLAAFKVLEADPDLHHSIGTLYEGLHLLKTQFASVVHEVRGRGFMWAMEFTSPQVSERALELFWENQLFLGHILYDDRSLRIYPPVVSTPIEIQSMLTRMKTSLVTLTQEFPNA